VTLTDYLRTTLRHWLLILVGGLAAGVVGLLFAQSQPARYETRARLVVAPAPNLTDGNDIVRALDVLANKRALVATLAQVTVSQRSFDQAISAVGATPAEARDIKITASVSPEANVVEVFVVGPRAELVERMMAALGPEVTWTFNDLYAVYTVQSLDDTSPKTEQVGPAPRRSALIAGFLGASLGFLVGIGWDRLRVARPAEGELVPTQAAGPGPQDRELGGVRGLPQAGGPWAADVDTSSPAMRAVVVHPVAHLFQSEHVRPSRLTDIGPGPWLEELDEIGREVAAWPVTSAPAPQEEKGWRGWTEELDELRWLLKDWADAGQERVDGDSEPAGP